MLTAIKEKVEVLPGGIIKLHTKDLPVHTLVTVSAIIETTESTSNKLTSYIGKGKGLFNSKEEVDNYVKELRDGWV